MDIYQNKNEQIKNEIFKFSKIKEKELKDISGMKVKIVEKMIYEKQKHLFPFKNWKVFDPNFK
jgi:hypothetical protein